MKNMADYDTDYNRTLKTLIMLLRLYDQGMSVIVRQKDSFCLYTINPFDIKSVLFAAVQIMKEGVVLTVYRRQRICYPIIAYYQCPHLIFWLNFQSCHPNVRH